MFPRTRFVSVLAIVSAGLVCWSLMPQPTRGQNPKTDKPAKAKSAPKTSVATFKKKSIPAPPPHRADGDFDLYEPDKAEAKIYNALTNPVEMEFIDTPLKDAMDFIADAQGIDIIIDEQALTEEGVSIDEPLNRILNHNFHNNKAIVAIKLSSELKIILDPLGLTYIVEDEVLKITTKVAADKKPVTRVYDTGYLQKVGVDPDALAKAIQTVVEPGTWRTSLHQASAATKAEEPVVMRDEARTAPPRQQAQNDSSVFRFQGAVLSTVKYAGNPGSPATKAPEPKSSIQVLGDMLVIEAPESVHRKIRDLLVQIDRRWELAQAKK